MLDLLETFNWCWLALVTLGNQIYEHVWLIDGLRRTIVRKKYNNKTGYEINDGSLSSVMTTETSFDTRLGR